MEARKLTKEDLDKVRAIEGFPLGSDEDIIALSNPPYYTACPNPFIEEFIKENGTPYDEATDDYHCEPFAADVSEGKSDSIYMAHNYHTKVPYKAIKKYIMHYTKPGDIVFDGFCGTGMTGVACQSCKNIELLTDSKNIGSRKIILNDLSPVATFIAYNCNREANPNELAKEIDNWLNEVEKKVGWVYKTKHNGIDVPISYSVWSQKVICPNCGQQMLFYDLVTEEGASSKDKELTCKYCLAKVEKSSFEKNMEQKYDSICKEQYEQVERKPVKIFYNYLGETLEKVPDENDISLLEKIENFHAEWYPTEKMMFKGKEWGEQWRAGYHKGITRIHHFYSKRSLLVLSELFKSASDYKYASVLKELVIASLPRASIRNRFIPEYATKHVGVLSGTLYIPTLFEENNIIEAVRGRSKKTIKSYEELNCSFKNYIISTGSISQLPVSNNSIDYIFTDPPFGDNLIYSELNFISESWLKVFTNSKTEAIICNSQNKTLFEYKFLMQEAFDECFRILKPNRWITVEFHNSQNAVWNVIQETLQKAGFIIADTRTLDKQKGTTKQLSYDMAVQQDLVISAYKPKESFVRSFTSNAGSEESAWDFVRQYLENLPVVVQKNGKIEIVSERQKILLFDRMVAFHIMKGIPVPVDAGDFYRGLDEKFIKRDGMYFLSDQVNEYDSARIKCEIESIEAELFVTNEKTAIAWLYGELKKRQTYAEIQPKFMQEIKVVDKHEAIPELKDLLTENFLQDDDGKWYVPDPTKETDVAKLREKKLLKEFEEYMASSGKLKKFRSEAVRAGFKKLWAEKDYASIVKIANRLPEETVQEDSSLLMYYDISCSRVNG